MKMSLKNSLFLFIAILIIGIIASSFYVINEGQQALISRLGKIITNRAGLAAVENPGLHFKIPIFDQANLFDMRLQTDETKSSRIYLSAENNFVVDYYI